MKNSILNISLVLIVTLLSVGQSAQAQRRTYHVNSSQVSEILQRLRQSSNQFHSSLNTSVSQGRGEGRRANDVNVLVRDFDNALAQLNARFSGRRDTAAEARNVVQKASSVNDFIGNRRFDEQTRSDWAAVRSDLDSLANAYSLNWQWNAQSTPGANTGRAYRITDAQLNQLIQRVENGGVAFRTSLTSAFNRNRYDPTRGQDNMNDSVASFKLATDQLRTRFNARQSVGGDVDHLLDRATPIDSYMQNNRLTTQAQNDWSRVRRDLIGLADAYNTSPNWGNGSASTSGNSTIQSLTGTFRLDSAQSDSPREIADRATRNLSYSERQTASEQLLMRLEAPDMLAIERTGSSVTIASTRAPQTTLVADGREHQERLPNGRYSRLTATATNDQLVISSNGLSGGDFSVTFDAIANGRLRVTRTIYFDRVGAPVIANSVYTRTSNVAEWNVYNGSQPVLGSTSNNGSFVVRDGESLVATLNTDLTTKVAKPGDRFTLTVHQPSQYDGATIEGTVATVERSGRLTGRSQLSLDFDTIRLTNGQSYKFAGVIDSVRMQNGDTVQVDNEGALKEHNSQTTRTVERAGIGTAIGAIIGAIAGGGKGAIIGGVIGAAGGAGSVYVQGKDDIELPSGTDLTIRASSPR